MIFDLVIDFCGKEIHTDEVEAKNLQEAENKVKKLLEYSILPREL